MKKILSLSLILLTGLFPAHEAFAVKCAESSVCIGDCPKGEKCTVELKVGFPPTAECVCKKKRRQSTLDTTLDEGILEDPLSSFLSSGEVSSVDEE